MKHLRLIVMGLALLCVSGCLDYSETLFLEEDGSGRIVIHFQINREYLEKMKEISARYGQTAEDPLDSFCSEDEVRRNLEAMNSSIDLIQYTKSEGSELLEWDFEFAFNDQSDFEDLARACPERNQEGEDSRPAFMYSFLRNGGSWDYVRDLSGDGPDRSEMVQYHAAEQATGSPGTSDPGSLKKSLFGGGSGEQDETEDTEEGVPQGMTPENLEAAMDQLEDVMKHLQETNPEAAAQMEKELNKSTAAYGEDLEGSLENAMTEMADHYMVFQVHFPGDVIESNATETAGNTATWKYSLADFQNAPESMTARIKR